MPRLQIVTIEDLLEGRLPKLPPIPQPTRGAPPRVKHKGKQLEMLLPFEGVEIKPAKGEFVDPRYLRLGQ